jgi:hypothetical protein
MASASRSASVGFCGARFFFSFAREGSVNKLGEIEQPKQDNDRNE